jgi:two-component system response regulator MprA
MCRVLYVEDDRDIRESLATLLTEEAFTVSTASNGLEAMFKLVQEPAPDVIVLDLMMPTLSGWELLNELRNDERLSALPVLVLSGMPPPPGRLGTGDAYMQKPFNFDALVGTINRLAAKTPAA